MPQLATAGAKVPVTVITGFLGSGKSTLLNHLLAQRGDKNIAVIENEFGEVNIDKTLVADQLAEREDLVSLENGCVCCGLRKDIVRAFAELQKRSASRNRPMDHILLETTGLADPSPVAFTFFANPWIAARFKLDSITCVVDARYMMQHLEDAEHGEGAINEAVQQLAFSDLILLNKVDLVDESSKDDVFKAIKRINNTARIIECQLNREDKRPDIDQILGTNSFSVQRALTVDPQFLDVDSESDSDGQGKPKKLKTGADGRDSQALERAGSAPSPQPAQPVEETAQPARPGKKRAHEQTTTTGADAQEVAGTPGSEEALGAKPKRRRKKLHDLSDVSSVGITTSGQLDEYRFNMFMRDLLSEKAKDIFRCKGVLCVHGYGSKKFVFQGVHETICYGPAQVPWQEGETRVNQIVFIGRGLDRKMLADGLRTCLWRPLPPGWDEALDENTKKPFFWNKNTGERTWTRPGAQAPVDLTSHHASMQQPPHAAPSILRTRSGGVPPRSRTTGGDSGAVGSGGGGSGASTAGSEPSQGGTAVAVA